MNKIEDPEVQVKAIIKSTVKKLEDFVSENHNKEFTFQSPICDGINVVYLVGLKIENNRLFVTCKESLDKNNLSYYDLSMDVDLEMLSAICKEVNKTIN